MIALLDRYSNQEFIEIIKSSYSYKECLENLGYHSNSGDSTARLRQKIQQLNIDTSHFTIQKVTKRNPENIFIENSTANQNVLRKWYLKGNYTEYKCSICGQEPFWQGKPMTLILDHINGKNRDDRLENLRWVCPNCNQQLETTNGKNKKQYSFNYCVNCGKKISKKAVRCCQCSHIPLKQEKPISREKLKELIRTSNFTAIGRQYGVTDNTIRKWCVSYNLPKTITEIKAISNENWAKI